MPPAPRRRRWLLLVVGALVLLAGVVGVLVSLGVIGGDADGGASVDEPAGAPSPPGGDAPQDGDPTDPDLPDAPAAPQPDAPDAPLEPEAPIGDRPGVEPSLDAPDLADLDGDDAVYAQLLIDIDRSEQTMIVFQELLGEAFAELSGSPDLIDGLREVASVHRDLLEEVGVDLADELEVGPAEEIRAVYVAHLESWVAYMGAVADDPSVLAGEGADGGFTVVINQTADAFRRTLDARLPLDTDVEVQNFAEGILDRGFRGFGAADV